MTGSLLKYSGAGLITGTLDILCAFVYYFIKTGKNPLLILKYIASGVVGSKAYNGGGFTYFLGLTLHFLIAISFSLFFFFIYPLLKKYLRHSIFIAVFYGLFIWVVMNLIVVPVSAISAAPFNLESAVINLLILIGCFGFPLEYMARKFPERSAFRFWLD
jgi:hypothetical protein